MGNEQAFGFSKGFQNLPTYHWNAGSGAWEKWEREPESVRAKSLKVLSWNVLRTDAYQADMLHELRIPVLLRQVQELTPDIIAFQEVTPPFMQMLLRQPWVRDSYFMAGPPELFKGQKMRDLLLSKFPPEASLKLHWSAAKQPTGMRWSLNGRPFLAFSLHLPSDQSRDAVSKRSAYLRELQTAIGNENDALLLGDFNLRAEAELPPEYTDLWPTLEARAAGHTFHPKRNPLAAAIAGKSAPARFDRIYLKAPDGRLLPQAISLLGTAPTERHGHQVWPSDHFGVCADILAEVTFESLRKAPVGHRTALAFIPYPMQWREIQSLRRAYDDRFTRWMPHVNLLFGFIPATHFPAAAVAIHQALADIPPFKVRMEDIGQFDHRESTTLWLKADPEGQEKLQKLRAVMKGLFPQCMDQDRHGDFIPHLTVGKFPGRHRAFAASKRLQWKQDWEGLEMEVGAVCLLARGENGPFRVVNAIPLGGEESAKGSAAYAASGWDLETSLDALGLGPSGMARAELQRTEKELRSAVRKSDPKCQFHSIGLTGLGATLPDSTLEYLGLGRLEAGEFLKEMQTALGESKVQGDVLEDTATLALQIGSRKVTFHYVQIPKGISIRRPSSFNSHDFSQLSPLQQAHLSHSLETAALRRILGPQLPIFQSCLIALQCWLGPRPFPDLQVWTLLLAAAPFEESPELWLENAFQFILQHDFTRPICPLDDFAYSTSSSPMQVMTPTIPQVNAAFEVTTSDLVNFLDKVESGLESILQVKQGRLAWSDFLL